MYRWCKLLWMFIALNSLSIALRGSSILSGSERKCINIVNILKSMYHIKSNSEKRLCPHPFNLLRTALKPPHVTALRALEEVFVVHESVTCNGFLLRNASTADYTHSTAAQRFKQVTHATEKPSPSNITRSAIYLASKKLSFNEVNCTTTLEIV